MLLLGSSPTGSKPLYEKNIMNMLFNLYLCQIFEQRIHLSSIFDHVFSLMITNINEIFQYTSSKSYVFEVFILNIVFFNYSSNLSYLGELICSGSNGIKIIRLLKNQKKISYLLNFSFLFSKKDPNTTKNQKKTTKYISYTFKAATITSIIIEFLWIINLKNFERLYEGKQHLSLLKQVVKFFENTKNYQIEPLLSFRSNSKEIIWDVGLGCESETLDQGRSYEDKTINISNCFFKRYLSYSGDGGVICINSGSYSMSVNYSMFYNCVCSSSGGAIYFSSSNSYLRMICANSCSASSYHFAYLVSSQMNQVDYLSVSNCSHTTSGYYSIRLGTGNQCVDNTNSSMNNAYQSSGIFISSPSSFTSSHCTFSNNKVSGCICIYFYSISGTISMLYANIVHNNSPSYGVVYVEGAGSRMMMYCIFKSNQNYLFCVSSGSLEVSHSFIDHSASISTSTAVSISNNNSFTNTITYQLQFFKSIHCNADIPLLQRSVEETIRRTNEETIRMTYEKTIDQTIRETIINTLNESPMNTLKQSPINTIDQTIRETPRETIHRSYAECMCTNQIAYKKEISVIFSFSFLNAVIILMIL